MAVHITVFVLLTQPDAARIIGDMNKIRHSPPLCICLYSKGSGTVPFLKEAPDRKRIMSSFHQGSSLLCKAASYSY